MVGSSVSSTEVSLSSSVSLLSSLVDGSSSFEVSGEVSSSSFGDGAGGAVVVSGSSGSEPGLGLRNPGLGGLFLDTRFGRGLEPPLVGLEPPLVVLERGGDLVVVLVVLEELVCDLDRLDWNLLGEAEVKRDLDAEVVVLDAVVDSEALDSVVCELPVVRGLLLPIGGRGLILLLPWNDRLGGGEEVVVLVVLLVVLEVDLLPDWRFLFGEKEDDDEEELGLNLLRPPPSEGRPPLRGFSVVVVASSVVVGGSVVVVVEVVVCSSSMAAAAAAAFSSTDDFRSDALLSRTLFRSSSSDSSVLKSGFTAGGVAGTSVVSVSGVSTSGFRVVGTSVTTKFGRTGNRGTSLLP